MDGSRQKYRKNEDLSASPQNMSLEGTRVEVYRKFGGCLPVAVTVRERTKTVGNGRNKTFWADSKLP